MDKLLANEETLERSVGLLKAKAIKSRRRYVAVLFCLYINLISAASRVNIGVAVPAFIHEKSKQGEILSVYYLGCLLTQILGGYLVTTKGAKFVLLTGVSIWAIFDILAIIEENHRMWLILSRIGVGFGQGITMPCMHHIAAAWYPIQERGRLVAIVMSGTDLGIVLSLFFSPWLLANFGWRSIYIVFGGMNFMWLLYFYFYGVDKPEDDKLISIVERDFIISNRMRRSITQVASLALPTNLEVNAKPKNLHSGSYDWGTLLLSRAAWAIYVAHFCFNYGWFVLLNWVPQYFEHQLHLELRINSYALALPYLAGYMGVVFFGRLGDVLIARGYRIITVRRSMNATGQFGAAIFLFCLRNVSQWQSTVFLLSLALFFGRAVLSGFFINMIDIAPNHAAHVMAVSNTISFMSGILGNILTGRILAATGDWVQIFMIACSILVIGGTFYHFNSSDISIFDRKDKRYQPLDAASLQSQ